MRLRPVILLASLVGVALAAAPAGAADRYGAGAGAAAEGGQRYLGWSGKVQPSPERNMVPAPARPEPLALAGQYAHGRPMAPPQPQAASGPTYAPFVPQAPLGSAPTAAAQPQPQAASPGLPTSLYTPPPADARVGAPQQIAAATPARQTGEAARLYSVHRPYGLAPDAIPETPGGDRYVLIGPPDSGGVSQAPSDDTDDESPRKGERPF